MRSPWKLIAGFVSRGKPETLEELENEPLATADSTAEKGNVHAFTPSLNEAYSSVSTQHTDTARSRAPILPHGDPDRRLTVESGGPISNIALVGSAEPVLATTIRLVTKDRLTVRAELGASSAELDTQQSHFDNLPLRAKVDSSVRPTEPSPLSVDDANVAKEADRKRRSEHSDQSTVTQRAPTIARRVRNTTQPSHRSIPSVAHATPEEFFDIEAIQLDDEIDELRHQLAERLRLQNDYLRRMLARYDAL